jgi:tetratricopeptide (TPR) repeat protein
MRKHLFLSLAAGFAMAGVLRADDAAPAAASPAAAADTQAAASTDAKADTVVAKNDAPGSLKAGKDLLEAGKYAEAEAYFIGIGVQSADNGTTKREPYRLLNLSSAYLGDGKFKEAEDAAQQAIDLKKSLAAAWNNLGSAQANQGDRAKAIETYTKGIAELKADKEDTSKLETNLKYLQSLEDAKNGKTSDAAGTSGSAAASTSPAAAAADASPAAESK